MKQSDTNSVSVTIKNRAEEIPRLHEVVEDLGRERGLPAGVVNAVNVALEEVLTNIISYGYQDDREHCIEVRIAVVETDRLRIEVEDDSQPFNPLEAPDPDTEAPLEERLVGGLGIHLVKQLMDDIEYRRVADHNLLVMEKAIPKDEAASGEK